MSRNSFISFVFEHWSAFCGYEPGYTGDIGAIEIQLIDSFIHWWKDHALVKDKQGLCPLWEDMEPLHTHQIPRAQTPLMLYWILRSVSWSVMHSSRHVQVTELEQTAHEQILVTVDGLVWTIIHY